MDVYGSPKCTTSVSVRGKLNCTPFIGPAALAYSILFIDYLFLRLMGWHWRLSHLLLTTTVAKLGLDVCSNKPVGQHLLAKQVADLQTVKSTLHAHSILQFGKACFCILNPAFAPLVVESAYKSLAVEMFLHGESRGLAIFPILGKTSRCLPGITQTTLPMAPSYYLGKFACI